MNNMMFIFSLEGCESYTEVNFFKGMAQYFELNLIICAIGKQGKEKKSSINRIKYKIQRISPEFNLNNNENIFVFFIADDDNKNEKKSIERARDTVINELDETFNYNKKIKIEKKIICEPNKSFDDVLNINKSNFINISNKNHKKKSNKHLFIDILDTLKHDKTKKYNINEERSLIIKLFAKTGYEILFKKIFY